MTPPSPIYFDNNATTRMLPEVLEAMLPYLRDEYANPSSLHRLGQSARHAVEQSRAQIADLMGVSPREIVFTSGGTESINLALRGAVLASGKRRIITTAVEHPATLRVAERLAEEGFDVRFVGVDGGGALDEQAYADLLTDEVALVSLLHANNETGVIFDVPRLAALAAQRGIIVHTDVVQSAGKVPLDVGQWPVHLASIAAHKFHGPKGVGALYVRRKSKIKPQILGGSQERMLRGGTENVAGIVGMGVAGEMAGRDMRRVALEIGGLRDRWEAGVVKAFRTARINGAQALRIHNTSNISFEALQAEAILVVLSEAGICASSGAACSSGSLAPSHVLQAMHIDERFAHGAVRFSFSRLNTVSEVDYVLGELPSLLAPLTGLAATARG